jgi:hypothetical protein
MYNVSLYGKSVVKKNIFGNIVDAYKLIIDPFIEAKEYAHRVKLRYKIKTEQKEH